jgi:branched-chain amino acid transport system permease protein
VQATSGSAAAGTTRIVNLGVAAFFGLGAFVCAALLPVVELPVALVAAAGAGMALGLVPAPIAGRLTGVFMAILTVGLTLLAQHVFRILPGWTGGTAGRTVDDPIVGGVRIDRDVVVGGATVSGEVGWLLGCSLVLVLVVVTTSNLLRSRIGRALSTLATSPVAARSFGISPARLRSTTFLYSSALAAAGSSPATAGSSPTSSSTSSCPASCRRSSSWAASVRCTASSSRPWCSWGCPSSSSPCTDWLPCIAAAGSTDGITAEQFSAVLFGVALAVVMVVEPGGLAHLAQRVAPRVRSVLPPRHTRSAR